MSRNYKMHNREGIYFLSFATVSWIDVFTRRVYKDILIDSLKYCQKHKGMILHAWCIMSNHVHLIASAAAGSNLSDILRDFKKFTSKKIISEIGLNPEESRKEWMLVIFRNAGAYNPNNELYQFWQQHNKPIVVYSPQVISQKLEYIHRNPVVAGYVAEPVYYLYSSAYDYAGGDGLLELALLV